jgi:hypothetical protein
MTNSHPATPLAGYSPGDSASQLPGVCGLSRAGGFYSRRCGPCIRWTPSRGGDACEPRHMGGV